MFKEKDFILHFTGLIVLSMLAVFFGVLEYRSGKSIIDIGIVIGILGALVTNHSYNAIKKKVNGDETSI